MQFKTPEEFPFRIPADWEDAADMAAFAVEGRHYDVDSDEPWLSVRIAEIAPLKRHRGPSGFSEDGFNEQRMISILQAFRNEMHLPPVELIEKCPDGYRYQLYNGVHRYYASVAAGFSHLPVSIKKDIQNFLDDEE
jgi:hypothetical protein